MKCALPFSVYMCPAWLCCFLTKKIDSNSYFKMCCMFQRPTSTLMRLPSSRLASLTAATAPATWTRTPTCPWTTTATRASHTTRTATRRTWGWVRKIFSLARLGNYLSDIIHVIWRGHLMGLTIQNIATNVTSIFTRTCRLFSIVVTSSKNVGNFDHRNNLPWSFEQVFLGFTESRKPHKFVN